MFTKRPYSFWAVIIIVLISSTWLCVSAQTKAPLTRANPAVVFATKKHKTTPE